jgi:myo-inositol-1(or 4)-monophosphatase
MDLQAVRAAAVEIAYAAGAEVMRYYRQPHQENTKSNVYDIVTEGDKASEAIVVSELMKRFPDHYIISEEGGISAAAREEAEYFWHIDPIDGTTNFANNIPLFTVSISMTDKNMRPLVGVVLNPVYNECFSAARGLGATLNDEPIHVTGCTTLERSVVATGFSSNGPSSIWSLRQWESFTPKVRGLRRFGSVALELAFVASGRLDGLWEHTLHSWDIMAGLMLVEEAGGKISDYSGGVDKLYGGCEVVASNGLMHSQILEVLDTLVDAGMDVSCD